MRKPTVKPQESARGPKPFRTSIVPGGVYAGGGRFLRRKTLFQSKNRFLAVSAPGNLWISAETGGGGSGGGVCSPVHQLVKAF